MPDRSHRETSFTSMNASHRSFGARLAEFREQRFGLFIHWGLYALAARHEWVKQRERLTDERYRVYFEQFAPDLFDPDAWAEAAGDAGMRYMVLTTKHHDGFCLWDSALTDYCVTGTPYGKDLVGPIVSAFRAKGLGVGFYHSLIDWHHPDFPIDGLHPAYAEGVSNEGRDITKYADYLHGQVEELLTRYGPIDTMWFDFSYSARRRGGKLTPGGKGRADWRSEELVALVRRLQPGALINDRLEVPGDFVTPEQYQPAGPVGEVWEACQTLNGSWGYDRDNLDWKPVDLLVRMLVDTVSKDGNLLLNVGPNGRGEFEPGALATLRGIGEWMRLHGRSIYGAGPSAYQAPPDCRYTQAGDRLYVHLFSWPYRHLHLPGLAGRVRYAQLLNDASEIRTLIPDPSVDSGHTRLSALPDGTLTLQLPVRRPDVAVPVIELFL
ncbi:alpha-L-fucosidase [Planotetraspora sp. GP83]